MTRAYYNEVDPKVAEWLRQLIRRGLIAPGDVDNRSIEDVRATDLVGYDQCHFFAGIGGWSCALRLAGWPDDRPIWTGSCPCQPLSVAGLGLGADDERHLWPDFARLIAECGPPVVAGEQVASAAGRDWLAAVRLDLEAMGYGVGAADLCAAGVGAPHVRQRIFWIADAMRERGARQGAPGRAGEGGQGWQGCAVDLREITGSPYVGRCGFPQPLIRGVDDGLSDRVVCLRGYGNAIVPQVAAEFMAAFMEATA